MERHRLAGEALPVRVATAVCRAAARGALIVYPTETQYGLGCDPRNTEAVARLLRIKGRPAGMPLPLIAADASSAQAAVRLVEPAEARRWRCLTQRFWPGPLTLVAAAGPGLAPGVAAADGSVGLRVPSSHLARWLAGCCGGLLVAASANRSGVRPASDAGDAAAALGGAIDILIDGGPASGTPPSTVLDPRGEVARLLRAGPIGSEALRSVLGEAVAVPG